MGKTVDYLDYLDSQVDIAPAASQEELSFAQGISELFAAHGLEPELQEFDAGRLGRLPYAVCGVVLLVGTILSGISGAVGLVGLLLALVSFVLLLMDRLGHSVLSSIGGTSKSQNVIAVHRATGDLVAKGNRPIVVVAHYDTPREDLLSNKVLSPYQGLIRRSCAVCVPVAGIAAIVAAIGALPTAVHVVSWVVAVVASIPPALVGVSQIANRILPCTDGANDNKASVAALLSVLNVVRPAADDVPEAPDRPEPAPMAPAPTDQYPDGQDEVDSALLTDDYDDYDAPYQELQPQVVSQAAPTPAAVPSSYEPAPSAVGEPVPSSPSDREAPSVRHGRAVIESIGMLPADCEISYLRTPAPVVPAPAAQDVPEQAEPVESEPAEPEPIEPPMPSFLSPSRRPRVDVGRIGRPDDDVVDASYENAYDDALAQENSGRGFDTEHAKEVAGEAKDKVVMVAHKGRSLMSSFAGKVRVAAGKAKETAEAKKAERGASAPRQDEVQWQGGVPVDDVLNDDDSHPETSAQDEAASPEQTVADGQGDPLIPGLISLPTMDGRDSVDSYAFGSSAPAPDDTTSAAPLPSASATVPEGDAQETDEEEPPSEDTELGEPAMAAEPAEPAVSVPTDSSATLPIDALSLSMDEDPGDEFDKDTSGLDAMPHDDPSATKPMPVQDMPAAAAVDDPSWGTSSFHPASANVARRAVLFDLPNPETDDPDPLASSRPLPRIDADEGDQPAGGNVVGFSPRGGSASTADDPTRPTLSQMPSPQRIDGGVDLGSTQLYAPIPPTDDEPMEPRVSDDIGVVSPSASRGAAAVPAPEEEPSRKHHLFGHKAKKSSDDDSMGDWLGVGDDYDAKKDGRQIGSWENLASEDDAEQHGARRHPSDWKGGAAVSADLRDTADEPDPDDLRDEILHMGDDQLVCHDIWFVATGASALDHAGMKAFLEEHRRDIRGAFLVNLDCVGAGDLAVLTREGATLSRRADRRLVGLVTRTADALHVPLDKIDHSWGDTDATPAMRKSVRAITVMGTGRGGSPALSHTADDVSDQIDARQVDAVAQVVCEAIRRS
ncbi:MAG: M28 family peptidase [Atopobiaceae bacterium]|nr:M28 family peptidase [Atopobiaceae bacterium]MCH4180822.1 M28 family peptidase [Atopobiaceae bacterium]MCH4214135.1 M28 family peptidase [Atopobiaceae bacterium]MCH4229691.1 M28 family peptidase [Atopobiaceae bacterium]MCH4276487.1 M28 family peptidase [Atopobiaceae bacterium]